jgi:hypothetical protein
MPRAIGSLTLFARGPRAGAPFLLSPGRPVLPWLLRRTAKIGKIEKKAPFRRAAGRNLYPGNSIVQEVARGVRRIFQAVNRLQAIPPVPAAPFVY